MTVVIASKNDFAGVITPVGLSTETTVVAPGAQTNDAMVEGDVDLSNMQSGDTVLLTEYLALDGSTFVVLNQQTFIGAQSQPMVRFPSKLVGPSVNGGGGGVLYKTTVNQTAGTVRAFRYSFTLFLLGSA